VPGISEHLASEIFRSLREENGSSE
jgi:hypothetical protein